ncbi:hypothetical protein [Hydrogenophaga sp.]|uniref:hypothetical protein n=1 Tax=Hydrogenophaga sp. TaxID=1904254 RepID=UPI00262008A5|nr:hypothetical protein [Hydrogenophaga sp.]MCW5653984.1 hypothetical protein [Hydrogenophaga sp.]
MPTPSVPSRTLAVSRMRTLGLGWLGLWLLALLAGPALLSWLGLAVHPHGHATLYAHGHPFVDARSFLGLPNAMDVLSNLPLAAAGVLGLWVLGRRHVAVDTWQALLVFFGGLVLTALGSAWYHLQPDPLGLVIDRAGMAVTFAGALSLAVAERASPSLASQALCLALLTALASAVLPFSHGHVLPWVVVQFGGMVLIGWAALQPPVAGALGVRLGWVLALYALAKLLEMADEGVFQFTGGLVSGHTLKHLCAAAAAWPVIAALRAVRLGQNAPTARRAAASRHSNTTAS